MERKRGSITFWEAKRKKTEVIKNSEKKGRKKRKGRLKINYRLSAKNYHLSTSEKGKQLLGINAVSYSKAQNNTGFALQERDRIGRKRIIIKGRKETIV